VVRVAKGSVNVSVSISGKGVQVVKYALPVVDNVGIIVEGRSSVNDNACVRPSI
jgi:hypothetical protein